MATVGFIGLGNMGAPMASNLLRAGHRVQVFDLVESAMMALASEGAVTVSSAAEAVKGAEFVLSMLPAGRHVESLYLSEENGLLDHIARGTLIIDSSTIEADIAIRISQEAAKRGLDFVDAPVSGGVGGAEAGTLSFMIGGSWAQFEKAQPLLACMGKNLFHAGQHGAGQVAKCCNNMLLAVLMAGTAEALNLGVENGLDPQVLSDIMKQSSGNNWALQLYNPWPGVMENVPASKGYQGGFQSNLMVKDLGLAMTLSQQSGASTPLGGLARSLYQLHASAGSGSLDFSSIQKVFRKTP